METMQSRWNTFKTALLSINHSNFTHPLQIHTIQCEFSTRIQWLYFHRKRVRIDAAIPRILKMNQNPSKSAAFGKNLVRALSTASCCNKSTINNMQCRLNIKGRNGGSDLFDSGRCRCRSTRRWSNTGGAGRRRRLSTLVVVLVAVVLISERRSESASLNQTVKKIIRLCFVEVYTRKECRYERRTEGQKRARASVGRTLYI